MRQHKKPVPRRTCQNLVPGPPTAIDLFSGCGGLTRGLRCAGFSVLAAIEIDEAAAEAFKANNKDTTLKRVDIRRVSARGLRKELKMRRGQLDLLAGCPPCQGFSTLRTKNGAARNRDPRNNLIREMLRFAKAFLPRAVMMENVPRLAKHKAFADLRRGLSRLGYEVRWDVKDCADFGVPQRRRRLVLVAARGLRISFARKAKSVITVKQAIGSLPAAGESGDKLHDMPEKKRAEHVRRLIRDIPKNGGSRRDLPHSRQLDCHRRMDGFRDIYGRMAWDDVAPTITSGCFNPSKGRFLHPTENRAITMREAAILQSFPRRYRFPIRRGKEAIALMIGNALPPEFIRRHAREIYKALRERRA